MTTTKTIILTAQAAIDYAERTGATLCKYADPIEDAREGLTAAEAREIADVDPSLIWVDVSHETEGLKAIDSGEGWALIDPDGGWWWPLEDCATEAEARASYACSPMLGRWVQ